MSDATKYASLISMASGESNVFSTLQLSLNIFQQICSLIKWQTHDARVRALDV